MPERGSLRRRPRKPIEKSKNEGRREGPAKRRVIKRSQKMKNCRQIRGGFCRHLTKERSKKKSDRGRHKENILGGGKKRKKANPRKGGKGVGKIASLATQKEPVFGYGG